MRTPTLLAGPRRWVVLMLLFAACAWQRIVAQTAVPGGQRIVHQSWTFKDSAPEAVEALAQMADGYLWLGTASGLYRFDGLRFELFRSLFGDQLPSTNISALLATRSGGLWVGYRFGGFSFLKEGKLTNFVELRAPTGTVFGFAEDQHRTVWAAAVTGVWRFDGSSWQPNPIAWNPIVRRVSQVGCDRDGILWVLTEARAGGGKQLFYLLPDGKELRKAGDDLVIQGFTWDADHNVVTTHENGASKPGSGISLEASLPGYPVLRKDSEQVLDRAKGIWIIPREHHLIRHPADEPLREILNRAPNRNSEVYNLDPFPFARLVDREGSIWIGDENGLHRFSYSPLIKQELPNPPGSEFVVAPDQGGAVWISCGNGEGSSTLYRVAAGKIEVQRALPGVSAFAYRALDKTFWFGGEGGLWHMVNGSLSKVEFPPELADKADYLIAITQDGSGGIWLSFGPTLLYRLANGVWTKYGGRSDLPTSGVIIGFTDSLGRVWFGSTKSRLAMLDGDRVETFGPENGLRVGNVTAIRGRGPEIWIGGDFGLQQFDHGQFHNVDAVDQESLRGISGIVETANGDLWLNGLGGIVHLRQTEILQALKNPSYQVRGERFSRREGVPGLPRQLGSLPTAIEGTDGRLWFTLRHGVVWLDPTRASKKVPPPPVTIQSISADDRSYQPDGRLEFPPHTSNVQIGFAGLSLADPEAIHFRYKLQETDKNWHDAAMSTSVSYRNLPPGSYHFVVNASDTNGLWSGNTASAEFTISPAYYQTNWFRALCAAVLVGLIVGLYELRVQQLRREEKKMREAIETIPTMAWVAGRDGIIQFVNRRWAEYTGLSNIENPNEVRMDAIHPEDRPRIERRWNACVKSGERFEEELRFRNGEGEYRWFLSRAVPLRDKRGEIVKWYGASADIEDRKRAERLQADLAHTNRVSMLGELTASIAHEVNQPLSGIVSNAGASLRWLAGDAPNVEEAREAARRIVRDGKRAGEIIDRLRALYRKTPPKTELIDVNEIIGEMVVVLRGEANRFAVSIRTDLAADLPKITADGVQLQQVLMNLMLNGIEAMNETGGVLTIKSQPEDQRVLICVSDTGVGLPAQNADRIFEAFFTTKPQGSGMGLAISRSIVESVGGRIWATANDGRGASFHCSLPAAVHAQEAPAAGA